MPIHLTFKINWDTIQQNRCEKMKKTKNIIILEEVTSTNEYLKQYYKQLPDQTVVIAKKQLQGKGRLSRAWKSDPGNLYMSILKKGISRDSVFMELMNVSVSVVDLLKQCGIDAYIKYPNDIIVGRKKICGILIETMGFQILDYLVIGIGININQEHFQELSHKATSIMIETQKLLNIETVGDNLLQILHKEKDVYKEYIIHSYVIGKQIMYQGMPYIVTGVNLDGSMRLSGFKEINLTLNEISLEELYE
jgi:BirA family biotin operon repressor/biotin-[acetyl-CoA-carboxylase] ligase